MDTGRNTSEGQVDIKEKSFEEEDEVLRVTEKLNGFSRNVIEEEKHHSIKKSTTLLSMRDIDVLKTCLT